VCRRGASSTGGFPPTSSKWHWPGPGSGPGQVSGRWHVKRLHFLNAAGEVVRSLDHLDNCSFRFGRVGRWYWEQYRRVRMRGRTDRNIDLIADWGTRLTAP
jgi:hypothetical protein